MCINFKKISFSLLLLLAILILTPLIFVKLSDRYVIIQTNGGLGNQMFQYSAAYSLAGKTNRKLIIIAHKSDYKKDNIKSKHRFFELIKFKIPSDSVIYLNRINAYLFKKFFRLYFRHEIFRKHYSFEYINEVNFQNYYQQKSKIKFLIMDGFFINESFFKDYDAQVIEFFKAKNNIIIPTELLEKEAVCLHARKGDMISSTPEYYRNGNYEKHSIAIAKKYINNPKFYIFSDDIELTKFELKDEKNIEFIEGKGAFEDFYLMANCANNILTNSTFSWWAGYLNSKINRLVIAPTYLKAIFTQPYRIKKILFLDEKFNIVN